jgi:type I phosphodiesterase/nucleotide pyrophosphatase
MRSQWISFFDKPHTMKNILPFILLAVSLQTTEKQQQYHRHSSPQVAPVQNLIIITLDGFRWQEIFNGADSILINDENYCPDTATMKMMYWAATSEERRKKLMPFFWNVLASKGQVYGNRLLNNKVNVSNFYAISYPGYNEMLTGNPDLSIASNIKRKNPNENVLEWLNSKTAFKDKIAAFSSWDVFPFILNGDRNGLMINSGYDNLQAEIPDDTIFNKVQNEAVYNKEATRHDDLTFVAAREYLEKFKPRITFLSFGETDEMAHRGRYDLYLEKAAQCDKMIAELWHWVQSTPGYKDNTSFIITTDHGRGKNSFSWQHHAFFLKGSSQTWLAMIGPNISPLGEMKDKEQIYEKQIAQTIALMVGEKFQSNKTIAPAIALK